MWAEARPLCQEKARLGKAEVFVPFHRSELGVFLRLLLTKKTGLFSGAAADMFCFPQMGIISLFGSRADSSGSRRGLGVGGPGAAGSSAEQTLTATTSSRWGFPFATRRRRLWGNFAQ